MLERGNDSALSGGEAILNEAGESAQSLERLGTRVSKWERVKDPFSGVFLVPQCLGRQQQRPASSRAVLSP